MSAGLDQFDAKVKGWFAAVGQAVQEAAGGLAQEALFEIVDESPQFSGDFVSGWEASYDTPSQLWRPAHFINRAMVDSGIVEPYQRGDPNAIEYALAKAGPRIDAARKRKLGTSIYLSNSAHHDEYYAWKIENGEIDFRPENSSPDASHVVERAKDAVLHRFSHIGKSQFEMLRTIGV